MRTYSGLLILENIFDYIPSTNPDVANFASSIFNPNVAVVTADCGTTLGSIQNVTYDLEGATELSTGEVISKARIDELLFHGIYKIATRTLDTCVARGGICQTCFAASRPRLTVPAVGTNVTIQPEYVISTTVLNGSHGQTRFVLDLDPSQYTDARIYLQGVLLNPSSYTISGKNLTLTAPLSDEENLTVHYVSLNRTPFLVWLAASYAGSLLGMLPLPSQRLPVRSQLLTSLVPQNRLELLISYTQGLTQIPDHLREYMPQIKHPLERALYMLALNAIFANVTG